ncbi:MAG TPA: PadR family transcriptional regulator [Candidatus Cybelea sp.]|nr:PadR family transcriptional regulator [Candidatus Cybelea sp.]
MGLSTATFYVLVALAAGERHGYAIIKEVESLTNGEVALLPGTLYRLIGQLCRDKWIVEVRGEPDGDPRRRYYRLLPAGRRALASEVARLEAMVRLVRRNRLLASQG